MKTIAMFLILLGLAPAAPEQAPSTEAACTEAQGQWCATPSIPCGRGPSWCNMKTSDAGKTCSARSQCEGSCVPVSPAPVVGAKEAGQCSVYKDAWLSGDRYFIEDGVVVKAGVV